MKNKYDDSVRPKFPVSFINGIAELILICGIILSVAVIVGSFYLAGNVSSIGIVISPIVGLIVGVPILLISLTQYAFLRCFADLTYYNQCLATWKEMEMDAQFGIEENDEQ